RLLLEGPVEDLIDDAAVLCLARLVRRPFRFELPVELPIARIRVIEPVALVGGEDPEDDRENDQDPRKDVLEAQGTPGEALPREPRGSALVQSRGAMRRDQR